MRDVFQTRPDAIRRMTDAKRLRTNESGRQAASFSRVLVVGADSFTPSITTYDASKRLLSTKEAREADIVSKEFRTQQATNFIADLPPKGSYSVRTTIFSNLFGACEYRSNA